MCKKKRDNDYSKEWTVFDEWEWDNVHYVSCNVYWAAHTLSPPHPECYYYLEQLLCQEENEC